MNTATLNLLVPGMSKARPRAKPGGGRPYMPAAYRKWKAMLTDALVAWWQGPPLELLTRLTIAFTGAARGDLDNLAGGVMDAGTGVIWRDDTVQVIPHLVVTWAKAKPINSTITITVDW